MIASIRNIDEFRRSNPCNADGIFNWNAFTIMDGRSCFPRDITPMDIDFNVEIQYQHLMMESKNEGVAIPDGQMKALRSLIEKGVTLVCIWGKLIPTSWSIETRRSWAFPIVERFGGRVIRNIGNVAILEQRPTDCETVFSFLKEWAAVADLPDSRRPKWSDRSRQK